MGAVTTLSFTQQIIIAVVSSGGLVALIALIREWTKRRASSKQDVGYASINKVYMLIQKLLTDSGANRVVVIKSENGGGIPGPGSVIKNSVLFEICDSNVIPLRDQWQQVRIDQNYSTVLTSVNTEGFAETRRLEMDLNSVLFEFFDIGTAEQARFYRVCATERSLIYIAAFYGHGIALSSKDKVTIRTTAQSLCGIFKKHHSLVKIAGQNE